MQMDEMTQQNAALVEEATAASQSMADQARDLNQMMSRFRIDQTHQAAAPAATPAARANVVIAKASKAERRAGSRPWVKASAKVAAPSGNSAGDAGAPRKGIGTATTDTEWQEF